MGRGQQPPGGGEGPQGQGPDERPGQPQPPSGPGGGARAKAVAVAAATVVVVGAGAAGFLVLGGGEDDRAGSGGENTGPSASASRSTTASAPASGRPSGRASAPPTDDPRGGGPPVRPTIPGWKVVVNPKWGTAFDVPPDWIVKEPTLLIGFEDSKLDYSDPENWGKVLIAMSAPAFLHEDWCVSDDDKDGRTDTSELAAVGTKGAQGKKNTDDVALSAVGWWVYGGYTQPDRKSLVLDETAKPYTTRSGVKGSIARARSEHTPRKGKCATDGKAVTFGFRNSAGDFVSWNLYGATGVKDEVPDSTIMKILSTVRLHGHPEKS